MNDDFLDEISIQIDALTHTEKVILCLDCSELLLPLCPKNNDSEEAIKAIKQWIDSPTIENTKSCRMLGNVLKLDSYESECERLAIYCIERSIEALCFSDNKEVSSALTLSSVDFAISAYNNSPKSMRGKACIKEKILEFIEKVKYSRPYR
jgi:hypothetical protein